MTSRRAFFAQLASVAAAPAVLDPERLLWVPGRKLISIPRPRPIFRYYARELLQSGFAITRGVQPRELIFSSADPRRLGEVIMHRPPAIIDPFEVPLHIVRTAIPYLIFGRGVEA